VKSIFLAISWIAVSSAAPLGGPVPGYIVDARTGSIRPVLGIPGGMQLGAAIALPFQVTNADFDPNGNFAVAISNEKPSHLYLIQSLANPSITDMGAIADNSNVLGVNSTGQTAVLSAPGQLQFLTGIASTPVLSNALPTQALLGPISAGIIDNAGQCALLGTSSGSLGAFETFCADGTSQRIFTLPAMQIAAIALANQGQDAILADGAGQQVLRVANYSQSSAFSILASAADGLNTPVGLQVNGQQAIVADSAASSLFLIDLSGQTAVQAVALNAAPARLKFLANRTIILLNDPTVMPFTIFDLHAMQSFFIPTN
jgi:hypothetical protein